MLKKFKGFGSLAIHAGHIQDPMYAHLTPLYASSTYVYDEAEQGMRRFSGKEPGSIYSRWGNPTMSEAERKIAAMETYRIEKDGQPLEAMAILHASGMAAISSLFMSTLKAGDKILTHIYNLRKVARSFCNLRNEMNALMSKRENCKCYCLSH